LCPVSSPVLAAWVLLLTSRSDLGDSQMPRRAGGRRGTYEQLLMKIRWHREQERGGREPRLSGQHPIVPKKPFLPAVFCLAERFPWHGQGCCPSESCPGTPAGGEAAARRTAHRNPYAAAGVSSPR